MDDESLETRAILRSVAYAVRTADSLEEAILAVNVFLEPDERKIVDNDVAEFFELKARKEAEKKV